jgi:hypothetical protein
MQIFIIYSFCTKSIYARVYRHTYNTYYYKINNKTAYIDFTRITVYKTVY